jgi:hypothetical protein
MELMTDILIGAVASLVASVVWFVGGQIILTIKSRERIYFLLERLYDCADQFDTAIQFNITETAEVQADKILEYAARIREEIKFLTFLGKKKQLFNTLLYNAYYTTSYYKRLWVGYNEDQERNAILTKFKNKYYYSVPIYSKRESEPVKERSFLIVSVVLMQELNSKSVKKALEQNFFINKRHNARLIETYQKLVATQNFKSTIQLNKYDLREKTFTKEKYYMYLSKMLKNCK